MTRFTTPASVSLIGLLVTLAACNEPQVYARDASSTHDEARQDVAVVITDADIHASVVAELEHSPFVDADDVDVAVDEGHVVLRGEVDSISERDEAFKCAYQGGAKSVDDRLEVAHEVRVPATGERTHPS